MVVEGIKTNIPASGFCRTTSSALAMPIHYLEESSRSVLDDARCRLPRDAPWPALRSARCRRHAATPELAQAPAAGHRWSPQPGRPPNAAYGEPGVVAHVRGRLPACDALFPRMPTRASVEAGAELAGGPPARDARGRRADSGKWRCQAQFTPLHIRPPMGRAVVVPPPAST
jgi:hypothetical protein